MASQLHLVNLETCKGDGICADVCPEDVLEMVDGKAATVEDREDTCILCGQCGHPRYRYKKSIRRDLAGVQTMSVN